MSDERRINLSYLSETEIIEFYELFFGKILIKKPNFSYLDNLSNSLSKENSIKGALERLNQTDIEVLKALSKNTFVPNEFIVEKLNVILGIPTTLINKSITNLLQKKYIFLRGDNTLVIPDIYFPQKNDKIIYTLVESENTEYFSKLALDINNFVNYFLSKELKFSNSFAIYKKDATEIEERFLKYSSLKRVECNIISYFFSLAFCNEDGSANLDNIKKYYELSPLKRVLFFLKVVFPPIYAIITSFNSNKQNAIIQIEEFKKLWTDSFLITNYSFQPLRFNFNIMIQFVKLTGLLENYDEENFIIKYFSDSFSLVEEELRVSSNFNLYINANSTSPDFYVPALFSDFVKYNKIIEYEITESSIRRGVISGINYSFIIDFLNKFNIVLSSNVEKTIKQWFDKHASFYYATGTLFFCDGEEKGHIIKTLVKNGMVKAYEIKKDEVFLIPEEETKPFFNFLEKTGINYYKKDIIKTNGVKEPKIPDLTKFFK